VSNDGRPNFSADPWKLRRGGHVPTPEEAQTLRVNYSGGAYQATRTRCRTRITRQLVCSGQVGETMAFQADYVWMAGRRQEAFCNGRPINLSYDR